MNTQCTLFPECHESYRLDGSSDSVSVARTCAREYLGHCAPLLSPETVQDALMLVSEMVTNAVRHAPGPCCLYLVNDRQDLTIAVSDTSALIPQPRAADFDRGTGGFGWHLLRRLARRVDVYVRPPWGKTVCAVMRAPLAT
jgi:anti-sigma regulatory factor (Ser/Thr protein kinase)